MRHLQKCVPQRLVAVLCLLFLWLAPLPAAAQDEPPADPIAILFPQLAKLPAPGWLKEGVRVTYAVMGSSQDDETTVAGGGYVQYDLIALDKRSAVANMRTFVENDAGGFTPAPAGSYVNLPGHGEFWVNPAALEDAEQLESDALAVVRYVRDDGSGVARRVVRFEYTEGGRFVAEFDQESGVLVFGSHSFVGNDGARGGGQLLLVTQRQIRLPWKGKGIPTWLEEDASFEFDGAFTRLDIAGNNIPLPAAARFAVQQTSQRWSLAQTDTYLNGMPVGDALSATGAGQIFGGLWLPKAALTAKPRNNPLDSDPITGAVITWQRADGAIILTETGPSWESVLRYDGKTGLLTNVRMTQQDAIGMNVTELALAQ
jgi:hypothetical protein